MSHRMLGSAPASSWRTVSSVPARDQRWAQLTQAICVMGRELSVAGRLEQTVRAAAETTDARYAAIVLYNAMTGLADRIVHSVTEPAEVAASHEALLAHGTAWLATSSVPLDPADPDGQSEPERSAQFLAVPIFTGFGLYGTICVMEPDSAAGFTPDDRNLLASLADTTGVGVDCATAFEESERRGDWLSASTAVGQQLLTLADGVVGIAQNIAEHVLRLADARTVTIVVPSPDDPEMLEVRVAAGLGADELAHRSYRAEGTFALASMTSNRGQLRNAADLYCLHSEVEPDQPLGQVLAVPFGSTGHNLGAIVASRRTDQAPFAEADLRMAEDFARQAGLALELAEARVTHEQLEVQRERERIAHLLQDNVIQRLFSVGLHLQTAERDVTDANARDRLSTALGDIDETIRQVRDSLSPPPRLSYAGSEGAPGMRR